MSETITALNDRYRKGEITKQQFELPLKISNPAFENLEIEEGLFDDQARQIVVKRGKEVVSGITKTVTGLNVDEVSV